MDCGNKNATVETNRMVLGFASNAKEVHASVKLNNAVLIPPVYIGADVEITNAVVGPYVSIGAGVKISDARVSDSIIRNNAEITNAVVTNSLLGMHSHLELTALDLSLGDYSTIH